MITINGRNVNEAYSQAMHLFDHPLWGDHYPSRNGPMIELRSPAVTEYRNPRERVLFDAARDCNPYLHFFESLWMLAGRNDVAFLTQFTKTFEQFSDDGTALHGAYGHRWRYHFEVDQLDAAIAELKVDPMSRRVVTQMWDATADLSRSGKDLPCNTSVMWRLRDGRLDMTVTNRSNDAIWGAYGANVVHFSMLQEYVASCIGVKVGRYFQVSNSLHIYPELPVTKKVMENLPPLRDPCPYAKGEVNPYPLFWGGARQLEWDDDLFGFMAMADAGQVPSIEHFNTAFFREVVVPLWLSFRQYKQGYKSSALRIAETVQASDWSLAAQQWLQRRMQA